MDWMALLTGTAAGAVVLFVWYAVAWMVLPHHKGDFCPVPDSGPLEQALAKLEVKGKFYYLPYKGNYEGGHKNLDFQKRQAQGPNAMFMMMSLGNPMTGGTFVRGFLLNALEAFVCAGVLMLTADKLAGLWCQVGTLATLALCMSAAGYGALSNWMFLPWRFCWTSTLDRVVGFSLVGVVLYFLGTGAAA